MRAYITVPNREVGEVMKAAMQSLKPPPKLSISEWSDSYRMLSRATSAEPGRWRTARIPYIKDAMDALCDPVTYKVVCCFCAQSGKTEALILNTLGYFMHQDPAPILLVQPRIEDAKTFSKVRIAGMLRDTPVLSRKVADPRSRSSSNTLLEKSYPGGRLVLAGANSPAGLAGNPIRCVLLDEIDRYPPSAATEGDPVELAIKRTTSFGNRKIAVVSTPTDTATSRIWRELLASDFRQLWVPCPHCDEMQLLVWENVVVTDDDAKTARYVCKDHCGAEWTEAGRHNAVTKGEWIATRPFDGVAGFHLNALYTPWPNTNLKFLYKTWQETEGSPLLKKTFVNTVLALPWDEESSEVNRDLPTEDYPRLNGDLLVPKEVLVCTAGIDTQDNRLEIEVDGWGIGEECFKLDHRIFYGDPGEPQVWNELWEYCTKAWKTERGFDTFIRAISIDSGGHYTQAVYSWVRPRFRHTMPDGNNLYTLAIKGQAGQGNVWPAKASRNNIGKVPLWPIRVDPAREMIYGRLETITEPGPGYVHFPKSPMFNDDYFAQLKSHRCVTTINTKGFPVREWHKKSSSIRDEVFDCSVYSYSALCFLYSVGLDLDREKLKQDAEGVRMVKGDKDSDLIPYEDLVDKGPSVPSLAEGLSTPQWDAKVSRSKYLGG